MNKLRLAFLAAAVLSAACDGTAHAGLLGATVDVVAYFPTDADEFRDPGNRVVTADIEYPAGSYSGYSSSWQVDVADSTLTITNTTTGFPFSDGTFNGFILKVISGPTIVSAHVDAFSDFFPVSVSVRGGNEILLNFAGLNHENVPVSSVINFATVPEPASLAILVTGLFASGGFQLSRRRRRPPGSSGAR